MYTMPISQCSNQIFHGKITARNMRRIRTNVGSETAQNVIRKMQEMGNNDTVWTWRNPSKFLRNFYMLKQALSVNRFKAVSDTKFFKFPEEQTIFSAIHSDTVDNCRKIIEAAARKGKLANVLPELRTIFMSNSDVLKEVEEYAQVWSKWDTYLKHKPGKAAFTDGMAYVLFLKDLRSFQENHKL